MTTLIPVTALQGILDRTLDLSGIAGQTYDFHLVTSVPAGTINTVANLSLATGGNYIYQTIAYPTVSAPSTVNGGTQITISSFPVWAALTTNGTPVVGMAISKRTSGSFATSDKVISYLEYKVPSALTINTVQSQAIITADSGFTALASSLPCSIIATGIPSNTRIISISSDTSANLNAVATANGTSISAVIYTNATYTPKTSNGDDFSFTPISSVIFRLLPG